MKKATAKETREMAEGLPTLVLKIGIGDENHSNTTTLRDGESIEQIDSLYLGRAMLDAVDAIAQYRCSRGKTYEILIRGERR